MILDKLKQAYKWFGENVGPTVDILATLGIFRDSKRREKKVVNEKWWPQGALDHWHVSRYSFLLSKLDSNDSNILDIWMNDLDEQQQHHFKIGVANMSWTDDTTKQDEFINAAVTFLIEMASEPNDDARTAKADARDFIKDPPEEYPIVFFQKLAGRKFKDPDELRKWITDNWHKIGAAIGKQFKLAKDQMDKLNKWLDHPADPATSDPGGVLQRLQQATAEKKAQADRRAKRWI
jgi:hypothetical protein